MRERSSVRGMGRFLLCLEGKAVGRMVVDVFGEGEAEGVRGSSAIGGEDLRSML